MKEWLKKAYLFIITALVVSAVLGTVKGWYAMTTTLMLWSMMIMVVEFSYRQPPKERKLIRTIALIVILLIGTGCIMEYMVPSVSAVEWIASDVDGNSIIFVWDDSEPPFTVWVNGHLWVDDYPIGFLSIPAKSGETFSITVQDSAYSPLSFTAIMPNSTFSNEIWMLIALFVALALLAIWIPYAAFACAALGGFLMLMIVPDTNYAGYLRITAATLFIVGLGTMYIHGVSR